ncbi:MAG: hypothetical protein OHK0048_07970 [Rhodoferax sp.]
MSDTPPPRFVPTLTQVVSPDALVSVGRRSRADVEVIVDLVQRQVRPIFERRLEEEFDRLARAMVAKQWAAVSARLQDEMDLFVRQAVLDALNARPDANPNPNPGKSADQP